jgi:hypothetical protein
LASADDGAVEWPSSDRPTADSRERNHDKKKTGPPDDRRSRDPHLQPPEPHRLDPVETRIDANARLYDATRIAIVLRLCVHRARPASVRTVSRVRSMFASYLVEVRDTPVGILIRQGESYAFHALDPSVGDLEGMTFPDAFAAERAARRRIDASRDGRRTERPGGR